MVSSPVEAAAEIREPERPRTGAGRWRRRIAPLILLVLGLGAASGSWLLKLGTLHHPAPGLWPFIISMAIILSAAVLIVRPGDEPLEAWGRRSLSVAAGVASLGAFVVLFELIGFFVPAVLMLLLWLRVFGRESWRWTLVFAVAGPAVLYVIFDRLLGVPFPADLALGAFV
ncbi:tripartite tricarboxylate transporter TctB family protein [Arthrobacter sp. ZGTC131]|uniref:tripartite tricarboxylate transporter TctB family protein n=1 Tax=Arthrobacter sp. ZGTC131 TaxID=2058898 RepID=UPI000CE3C14A|nr:tripartite tricarboxylate transporter TctB family protein [Arthrobacter sp. ZGTC131]